MKLTLAAFEALRPHQWIKNLSIFATVILNGELFSPNYFSNSLLAFICFCLLSSSSYLVNDIIDAPKDRLHPVKKMRPIARGDVTPGMARNIALLIFILGLFVATQVNLSFFLLALLFSAGQYSYSMFIKKKAVLDIIGIAFFFILRAFAGEIATGLHLPIWIMLTVIFLSLFIASGKRHSELLNTGSKTRSSLSGYGRSLLNFYTTMFGVCTLITYAMFTFFEEPIKFQGIIHHFLVDFFPKALERKWYMITLFPVIFGIMRYGQIIFEMQAGERPERVVATDIPLILAIFTWGIMIVTLVYVL
ncbi:MAG: UbiA prenyltransferase family protein [Candidatus Shapirobacteria bacterium]